MRIKLNKAINTSLLELSKSTTVIGNVFRVELLTSDLKVLFIDDIINPDDYYYVNATFNGKAYDELNEYVDDYVKKELINEMNSLNKEITVIEFNFSNYKVLNTYIENFKEKTNLLKLSNLVIQAKNNDDDFFNLIYLTKQDGFKTLTCNEFIKLLNSDLFDNRVRVIVNQYLIKYEEKIKSEKLFNEQLSNILEY